MYKRRLQWSWLATSSVVAFALLAVRGLIDEVEAQTTCTISGSAVNLTSGSCAIAPNTTLNGSPAVHDSNSAQITTNNVTINPFNGGSIGELAEINGTIIDSSGSSINGNWSIAASAQTGGKINFQAGSAINPAFGGGGTALLANGANSQISATGLAVNLNGGGGNVDAKATNGGTIDLISGDSITYAAGGGGNTGLWATGSGSQILSSGTTLNMPGGGGGDTGVRADTSGSVTLNGGAVSVLGNGGGETGLLATGAGSMITATDVAASVSGGGGDAGVNAANGASVMTAGGSVSVVNGAGGLLQNGGTETMTGTNVTASGNGGIGFLFNSGGNANALTYSNGTIMASGASFSVQGSTANINLVNATATENNNTLLETTSSGNTTFNAQNSILRGVITTDPSTSTVNLTQQTVWTMTGNSNATNVTNNNSEIIYTSPTGDPTQLSSYKTLTANNYVGTGGTITLNTYLGNDSSPSDRLVINGGTARGSTALRIVNTAGPGDETVSNGILVVQTLGGATTVPGAFLLAGEVRAGAYDYDLFRGGINSNAPQDWFLRSTFEVVTPPVIPPVTPPEVDPPPILPSETPLPELPSGTYPIIGPELATYGVVQPIAREMGLTTLGTYHERVGDAAADAACLNATPNDNTTPDSGLITKAPPVPYGNCQQAVWGRLFGQQIDNHYEAFADPRASGQVAGIQSGADIWRGSLIPGQSDTAGVYFAYGNGNVSVDGLVTNAAATAYVLQHTGGVNLNAFSVGGYWTHRGPTGWYIDAVLQGSFYNGNAATQFANLPITGTGFISSLEGGYPIPLPWLGPGFVLEPEAQIIWQQVSFDDANDGLGPIGLGTTSGASGRLGLRAKWTIPDAAGRVWQPYVLANVWRDWGADATTMFGTDPVPLLEQATRLEFAGGLSAKILPGLSLYAQAGYQFAVSGSTDGGTRDGVRGDLGVHYTW